jgi:hypothetical protein
MELGREPMLVIPMRPVALHPLEYGGDHRHREHDRGDPAGQPKLCPHPATSR